MSLIGKNNYIKLFFVKYEAYNGSDLSFLAEIYDSRWSILAVHHQFKFKVLVAFVIFT